jgi:hypothetical protein
MSTTAGLVDFLFVLSDGGAFRADNTASQKSLLQNARTRTRQGFLGASDGTSDMEGLIDGSIAGALPLSRSSERRLGLKRSDTQQNDWL